MFVGWNYFNPLSKQLHLFPSSVGHALACALSPEGKFQRLGSSACLRLSLSLYFKLVAKECGV